jgi:hypothetical protein
MARIWNTKTASDTGAYVYASFAFSLTKEIADTIRMRANQGEASLVMGCWRGVASGIMRSFCGLTSCFVFNSDVDSDVFCSENDDRKT